jgi:hypothetical protein
MSWLDSVEWFTAVGTDIRPAFSHAHSWPEAMALCQSDTWGEITHEMAQELPVAVLRLSIDRYRTRSQAVDEITEVIEPMIDRKITAVVETNRLPIQFRDCVRWDILHCVLEHEFGDLVPHGFSARWEKSTSPAIFPAAGRAARFLTENLWFTDQKIAVRSLFVYGWQQRRRYTCLAYRPT